MKLDDLKACLTAGVRHSIFWRHVTRKCSIITLHYLKAFSLQLPHYGTPSFESVVNKRLKPHPPTHMSHCFMFLGILRTTMRNVAMNRQSDFLSTEHF